MRRRLRGLADRFGDRLGMDVVERSPYSPVPAVPPPEDAVWRRRASLVGLDFSVDEQLGFLEERLGPFLSEFERDVSNRPGFRLWNGMFQAGDAEALYAILRWIKPRRVLELGSGFSTHVAAAAAAANAREGHPTEVTASDPAPRTSIDSLADVVRLEPSDARALPLERFLELEAGDVLFVDTSHSVKLGSEVNRLILEVLPRLANGVLVHFHDVFLPYEYPRYLFTRGASFNEQYLLHAFLIGNRDWEVLLGLAGLFRERSEEMRTLIASLGEGPPGIPGFPYVPASFWIRRRVGAECQRPD